MYDPTGLSGELAIYSYSTGSDYGILGGHSWIGYQPNGGTTTTYGTWGNNPDSLGNGLHEDIELNIPCTLQDGCASRVTYLDDAQQAQLYALYSNTNRKAQLHGPYCPPVPLLQPRPGARPLANTSTRTGLVSNPDNSRSLRREKPLLLQTCY